MNDPYLASALVLSEERLKFVRESHGPWTIGEVDDDGFRTIRNPFNLHVRVDDIEANVSPLYLKIPECIESEQTLGFMGFDRVTARLIWRKYRSTIDQRPFAEGLVWCAIHYIAYVEEQATAREGITDQEIIKERMGFHHGLTTLFHIDTNCPATTRSYPGSRVLSWLLTIISRRYDFIYCLEETIGSRRRILNWSETTHSRTLDYGVPSVREGVDSWFDYVACLMKALEPLNGGVENVPVDLVAYMLERFCVNS